LKFRVIDLLTCNCSNSELVVEGTVINQVLLDCKIDKVKCAYTCAYKHISLPNGNVTVNDCVKCYSSEILEGVIKCRCGNKYDIKKGIPRFLPEYIERNIKKIQDTFSYEWKMFRFGEKNWGQDIEFRKNLFLQGIDKKPEELNNKLILDAGCGSGVLSIEMARSFKMEVVAIDLSFGIEKAYENNDNPFVHLIQGSVLELPFKDKVFDFLYCAGVLVHLPDSRSGFQSIIPKIKQGGRCFIWVYHPIDDDYHPKDKNKILFYNWIRKNVTSPMPIRAQYYFYLCFIPFFIMKQHLEYMAGKKKEKYTWREKMQGLFDMFSPIYQNRHTHSEVIEWYKENGFANIKVSDIGPYGFGVFGDMS